MDEEAVCYDDEGTKQKRMVAVDSEGMVDEKPRFEILSTKTAIHGFHPTHATIKDRLTGKTYEWNSRLHRKLRRIVDPTERKHHLPRVWTCEPHVVTWWLNLTNEIANAFWTISGIFAVWPSENADASARTVYAAGIIAGVFMIISCYLSYVEAINHSHADIQLPGHENAKIYKRRFIPTHRVYGMNRSPLGHGYHGLDEKKRDKLVQMGFPIIETSSGKLITIDVFDEAISTGYQNDEVLSARHISVILRSGKYVCTTQATHIVPVDEDARRKLEKLSYLWWTWTPALNHLGVLCALVGFLSAIVYLIPMCMGYALSKHGNAIMGVTLFFVDILQVIPYMCFVATGHIYIAEAAGSWWKPKFDSIGWWINVFNTVGAYGFLLCGALAIPDTVGSTCCPNMVKWGSAMSCFWGSCSYFVGGILMMVEFANPETIVFGGREKAGKAKEARESD